MCVPRHTSGRAGLQIILAIAINKVDRKFEGSPWHKRHCKEQKT